MKTKLEIKASKLIDQRNKLTSDIARYWKIIETENVIRKGATRNYDLKALLNEIISLYDKVIDLKLHIQCINMGLSIDSLPENANIFNIYKLSAYNELSVKLNEMQHKHTINPLIKLKKGKRALGVTEQLTAEYLKRMKDKYELLSNSLRKKIEDFNNNTEIDNIPASLTA